MKRFTAFLLVMVMMLSCSLSALAEKVSNVIEFEPSISNFMDCTSSEWFSSASQRALLACTLMLDLQREKEHDLDIGDIAFNHFMYLGKAGLHLILAFPNQDDDILYIVDYYPLGEQAQYTYVQTQVFDLLVRVTLEGSTDEYYKIDSQDFMEVVELLSDAFGSD